MAGKTTWGILAFFSVGLLTILRHEMWRDELQAWMIARDSGSLQELFFNLRYEGHPPVWHLLLYGLTRLTTDPFAMQITHLAIATVAVTIFVLRSPFPIWFRWLFVFGYYPVFQYGVVSRCYGMGMLLLFLFCTLYSRVENRKWWLFLLLGLMAQSSFPAAALALILGAFLLVELWRTGSVREVGLAVVVYGMTIYLVSLPMKLPADAYTEWAPHWHLYFSWKRVGTVFTQLFHSYFLGTGAFVSEEMWQVGGVLGFVTLCFLALTFAGRPRLLLLYLAGTFGVLSIFYIKYGDRWHIGFLFLWLMACLWLQDRFPSVKLPRFQGWFDGAKSWQFQVVVAMLVCHLVTGLSYLQWDWRQPYSGTEEAANLIKDEGLADALIITNCDTKASPLSGYLNREIYYTQSERFGTFLLWNSEREPKQTDFSKVVARAHELSKDGWRDSVIVTCEEAPLPLPTDVKLLRRVEGSREHYYLYHLRF